MKIFRRFRRNPPTMPPAADSPPVPAPAERVRCGVPTKRGTPCTNYVLPGTDRCRMHPKPADPAA